VGPENRVKLVKRKERDRQKKKDAISAGTKKEPADGQSSARDWRTSPMRSAKERRRREKKKKGGYLRLADKAAVGGTDQKEKNISGTCLLCRHATSIMA